MQPADNAVASQAQDGAYQSDNWGARNCEQDAKSFTQCLDQNQGNMQICGWYLEQLVGLPNKVDCTHFNSDADVRSLQKACQSAASQY